MDPDVKEIDHASIDCHIITGMLSGLYSEVTCGYLTVDMEPFVLIEGGAKGADAVAAWWATCSPFHSHAKLPEDPTDYSAYPDDPPFVHLKFRAKWGEYGKAAGAIRNQQMLDEGKPDLVLAFSHDLANSKGTKDMVNRARKNGVENYVIG